MDIFKDISATVKLLIMCKEPAMNKALGKRLYDLMLQAAEHDEYERALEVVKEAQAEYGIVY